MIEPCHLHRFRSSALSRWTTVNVLGDELVIGTSGSERRYKAADLRSLQMITNRVTGVTCADFAFAQRTVRIDNWSPQGFGNPGMASPNMILACALLWDRLSPTQRASIRPIHITTYGGWVAVAGILMVVAGVLVLFKLGVSGPIPTVPSRDEGLFMIVRKVGLALGLVGITGILAAIAGWPRTVVTCDPEHTGWPGVVMGSKLLADFYGTQFRIWALSRGLDTAWPSTLPTPKSMETRVDAP